LNEGAKRIIYYSSSIHESFKMTSIHPEFG